MPNIKFHITALDKKGEVAFEAETSESWAVSNLQAYYDMLMLRLWNGEIQNILIERRVMGEL